MISTSSQSTSEPALPALPSHDNTIIGNTIRSDGPPGTELRPVSITPAFLGGIVVLNGTYNNSITNNQTWVSAGSDLAWAEAVPDRTSAIGVMTYRPTLHCNMTVSEGGGASRISTAASGQATPSRTSIPACRRSKR